MHTFTIQHAVDFSTGVARIGKCHQVDKRELVEAEYRQKNIQKARNAKRIADITYEQIMQLRNEGLTIDEIAADLECARGTVYQRINERG